MTMSNVDKKVKRHSTFEKAVKPLMEWLNNNCHPHTHVIVDQTHAVLSEDSMSFNTTEFVKD
jgi:hypothetical protein